MKTVSYLLFTRFNLAIHFGCKKRRGTQCPSFPWLNEEYLTKRFEIFEQYTYPSIRNQTNQDFKWIVLFHKDTPHIFKQRIEKYEEEMKNFEAWYLNDDESENFENIIYQYVRDNLTGALITTRVDNDDLVHERFVESVKKDFAYQNTMEILAYPNGLQYDSRCNTLLSYDCVNNHFLSLYVSNVDNGINHIFQFHHDEIDRAVSENDIRKLIVPRKPPLWVEVITESNYSNATGWRFRKVFLPKSYSDEYGLLATWNGFGSYIHSMILGCVRVFTNRGKGLLRRIKKFPVKLKR